MKLWHNDYISQQIRFLLQTGSRQCCNGCTDRGTQLPRNLLLCLCEVYRAIDSQEPTLMAYLVGSFLSREKSAFQDMFFNQMSTVTKHALFVFAFHLGIKVNVESSRISVDAHMTWLNEHHVQDGRICRRVPADLRDQRKRVRPSKQSRAVQQISKLQVHYYCFVLAFVCVDYSHRDICTYTGVEAIVPLGGGEDNATKVYALVLQTALAEKYRNYFFTYRAPQAAPAAEVVAVDEAAEDT